MSIFRPLTGSPLIRTIAREIIVAYIRFVHLTSRVTVTGTEDRDRLNAQGQTFLIPLWHNRIAMMPYAWVEEIGRLWVIASAHRDGQLVSGSLGRFGFGVVLVDSKKGGSGPTRQMIKLLSQGQCIGITPDGPRGPRMRVRTGTILLAAMAQVPMVPVTYSVTRRRMLNSWDRFVVPLPFSRIEVHWGKAIQPPARGDKDAVEAARLALETSLTQLGDQCDMACGVDPISPAPEQGQEHPQEGSM